MSIIKVQPVRSDGVYKKIMEAPFCKKNDIYRYEMMKPFEKKWACYNVPMKADVYKRQASKDAVGTTILILRSDTAVRSLSSSPAAKARYVFPAPVTTLTIPWQCFFFHSFKHFSCQRYN